MEEYKQPDFYHFSEDSLALAKFVINDAINMTNPPSRLIDLCSGCGVIGVEVGRRVESLNSFTFVELQRAYFNYLKANTSRWLSGKEVKTLIMPYSEFDSNQKFDLVISNPPYFKPGAGRVSPNKEKQLCRSFDVGNLESLIFKMQKLKDKGAQAYIVMRHNPYDFENLSLQKSLSCVKTFGDVSIYKF